MNNYETVFIVTPVLSDAQVKEVADKFQGVITKNWRADTAHNGYKGARRGPGVRVRAGGSKKA